VKYTFKQVVWPLAIIAAGIALAVLWWAMGRPAVPLPEPVASLPVTEMTEPAASGADMAAPAPDLSALAVLSAEPQAVEIPVAAQPLAADQIGPAVTSLIGSKAALTFFQLEDFPRKLVATVDNLGRSHAPPLAWPISPTEGRFTVLTHAGATVVNADNGQRYTPLVLLLEAINVGLAVDLYVRMYPVLQQTYVDLGYPNRQFNDRLLQVINHLLATPSAPQVMTVQLTEVKGPIPSLRPWVRYEFADPALEALSSGQKIMLRVGSVNQNRLKARLSALRQEILKRSTATP
jgi:hypothetical protein